MRKLIIFLAITLHGCATYENPSLYSFLFNKVQDPLHESDHYQSCLFFAELSIDEKQLENSVSYLSLKNEPNLCDYYILASQTQDPVYINEFSQQLPAGRGLEKIWSHHTKLDYPISFIPPYISMARNIATRNDVALDKLISGLPFVDGSHAESLSDIIANLYNLNPRRVNGSFKRNKLEKKTVLEIKLLAEYLKRN